MAHETPPTLGLRHGVRAALPLSPGPLLFGLSFGVWGLLAVSLERALDLDLRIEVAAGRGAPVLLGLEAQEDAVGERLPAARSTVPSSPLQSPPAHESHPGGRRFESG